MGNSLPILFFGWWYSEGIGRVFKYIRAFFVYFFDFFSVKTIFKTLFMPWKRDVASYQGLTLQQRFQVWILNLVSRFVGFVIKMFTLISYAIFSIFVAGASLLIVIIWFAFPLLIIFMIIFSIWQMMAG